MPEQVHCKRHPDTSTGLRCGNCGDPICPRCMVHATVGIRCLDCGKAVALPTYQVTGMYLVRAILAAALTGTVTGFIYALFLVWIPLVSTLAFVGIGYLVAEAATAAAGRRRGRTMQYVVVGGILIALVLVTVYNPLRFSDLWFLVGAVAAILVGTGRVR